MLQPVFGDRTNNVGQLLQTIGASSSNGAPQNFKNDKTLPRQLFRKIVPHHGCY